jgi:hypothetical protein
MGFFNSRTFNVTKIQSDWRVEMINTPRTQADENRKQIKPISPENSQVSVLSQEQLQCEVDYVRAQQILSAMLENGLISLSEFNKITELNRRTFSPLLAEIMP